MMDLLKQSVAFLKGETAETGEGQSNSAAHRRIQEAAGRVETHGAREDGGRKQTHHGVCKPSAAHGGDQDG